MTIIGLTVLISTSCSGTFRFGLQALRYSIRCLTSLLSARLLTMRSTIKGYASNSSISTCSLRSYTTTIRSVCTNSVSTNHTGIKSSRSVARDWSFPRNISRSRPFPGLLQRTVSRHPFSAAAKSCRAQTRVALPRQWHLLYTRKSIGADTNRKRDSFAGLTGSVKMPSVTLIKDLILYRTRYDITNLTQKIDNVEDSVHQ